MRPTLPRPTTSFKAKIPNEVAYAGDVDFIGQNYADIKKIQEVLKKIPASSQDGQDRVQINIKKRKRMESSKKK